MNEKLDGLWLMLNMQIGDLESAWVEACWPTGSRVYKITKG